MGDLRTRRPEPEAAPVAHPGERRSGPGDRRGAGALEVGSEEVAGEAAATRQPPAMAGDQYDRGGVAGERLDCKPAAKGSDARRRASVCTCRETERRLVRGF